MRTSGGISPPQPAHFENDGFLDPIFPSALKSVDPEAAELGRKIRLGYHGQPGRG